MKNCLKLELQRLFHQKQLYIALGIGLAIAMLDVAQNIRDVASLSAMYPEAGFEGYSLFARWMGINGFTFGHVLFYLVWPVLAAVPFGWTYLSDKRSGYWQQLVTRADKRRMIAARYLAVFTGGGLAIMLPLLTNLLVNALFCPACILRVTTSLTTITSGHFLSELFYTHPWLHSLIWCGVSFLWGGAGAVICLAFGTSVRHSSLVTLSPLILLFVLDYVMSAIMGGSGPELSPLRLASLAAMSANPCYIVLLEIAAISAASLLIFWMQERKNELF